jgi:sigma-B regulation protein RsbU (phosphoserine phosphatase)
LRGFHKSGVTPPAILELLNQRLRIRVFPEHYCAVQYAVFDVSLGEIRYASAGLPPPLHVTATACVQLDGAGLPPGLFDGSRYETFTAQLAPGDAVLFATDGLTDARNAKREEFGTERLVKVCARNRKESADALLGLIFEALDKFVAGAPQHDDITAAILKIV